MCGGGSARKGSEFQEPERKARAKGCHSDRKQRPGRLREPSPAPEARGLSLERVTRWMTSGGGSETMESLGAIIKATATGAHIGTKRKKLQGQGAGAADDRTRILTLRRRRRREPGRRRAEVRGGRSAGRESGIRRALRVTAQPLPARAHSRAPGFPALTPAAPLAPPARCRLPAGVGRQGPGHGDVCRGPLTPRPRKGPQQRPKLGAREAATGTARPQPECEARAGRARLTAASWGATPTARTVARVLPGPASPRATSRARRLPAAPGLHSPGKRSHTCALRPAPATRVCQRGQERRKARGRKVCPPETKWGGAPLLGARSGPGQGRVSGLRTAQEEGARGGRAGASHFRARTVEQDSGPG